MWDIIKVYVYNEKKKKKKKKTRTKQNPTMLTKSSLDYIILPFHFPLHATDLLGKPGYLCCRIANILELADYFQGCHGFSVLCFSTNYQLDLRSWLESDSICFSKRTISGGTCVSCRVIIWVYDSTKYKDGSKVWVVPARSLYQEIPY